MLVNLVISLSVSSPNCPPSLLPEAHKVPFVAKIKVSYSPELTAFIFLIGIIVGC